jgi:hypothetical protein
MVAESKSHDDLNNVRYESSRTFRNKRRQYLKDKVNDLETNVKDKVSETYTEA